LSMKVLKVAPSWRVSAFDQPLGGWQVSAVTVMGF